MKLNIKNKSKFNVLMMVLMIGLYSSNVVAEGSYWSQELGYYLISPQVDSTEISGPGLPPGTAADVDSGNSYLLTTTYHYNDNLSFEFFYSGYNKLDINAEGSISAFGKIGSLKYLAPTLMANWTFGDSSWPVRPYLGVGINSMLFSEEKGNSTLDAAFGGPTTVDVDDTIGYALTGGFTIDITDNIYATAAYVYIDVDSEATISTPSVGTIRTVGLDAHLNVAYFNIGYRF